MATISGVVQSGGASGNIKRLGGAKIALRTTSSPNSYFGQTVADGNGAFQLSYPFQETGGSYYLQAEVNGTAVVLMALLGPTVPANVVINELTTIAAGYAGAQFLAMDGSLTGDALPMQIAAAMSANIVDIAIGAPSQLLSNSPNAGQTIALGVTQSLANLLASAVRSPNQYLQPLFALATPPDGSGAPTNTIRAIANIARFPANNVGSIYTQSQVENCYGTPVAAAPVAWTIAVKVNDSGNITQMFGGPANVAFDSRGRRLDSEQRHPGEAGFGAVLDGARHGRPSRGGRHGKGDVADLRWRHARRRIRRRGRQKAARLALRFRLDQRDVSRRQRLAL
ncbi:MAG TPA: hypothetical protein VFN10_22825 [Thermoanaerobaculia bacterium]|nr:hypothetical protein [Thermoanaerobaculia bacterium]